MAITDVPEFAHLTEADIENLASSSTRSARTLKTPVVSATRATSAGPSPLNAPRGRRPAMLAASSRRSAWWGGPRSGRGQDHREHGDRPQRHARPVGLDERSRNSLPTWEWDMSGASKHWRDAQLHAPQVHQHPRHGRRCGLRHAAGDPRRTVEAVQPRQPLYNTVLALGFEWGVGLQHLELGRMFKGRDDRDVTMVRLRDFSAKAGQQVGKDYVPARR